MSGITGFGERVWVSAADLSAFLAHGQIVADAEPLEEWLAWGWSAVCQQALLQVGDDWVSVPAEALKVSMGVAPPYEGEELYIGVCERIRSALHFQAPRTMAALAADSAARLICFLELGVVRGTVRPADG